MDTHDTPNSAAPLATAGGVIFPHNELAGNERPADIAGMSMGRQ